MTRLSIEKASERTKKELRLKKEGCVKAYQENRHLMNLAVSCFISDLLCRKHVMTREHNETMYEQCYNEAVNALACEFPDLVLEE